MNQERIDADLRRYILGSVPTVPYLEALLLLRENPSISWNAKSLSGRLYVSKGTAKALLAMLQEEQIAKEGGESRKHFHYAPPAELMPMLDRMAELYRTDLLAVTDMIHSRIDRQAHQFSEAFRLRKAR